MSFKASWNCLGFPSEHVEALTRSSNSLAVLKDRAFVFGGERKPRTPVDNVLYEIGLDTGEVTAHLDGPEARVGAGLTAFEDENALLLYGGRGGKAMTPLPGQLHRFDAAKGQWSISAQGGQEPEDRSYHTLLSSSGTVYLHAGCPAKGRLPTLTALRQGKWTARSSGPDPGRGGTALAVLSNGRLARFGGFAGYELGGPLELYDPGTDSWSEARLATDSPEPPKRSVHGFVGLRRPIEREGKSLVAILLYGEAGPAPPELGHDGAGTFHDDVWALLRDPSDNYSWSQLSSTGGPSPRGWLGVAPWHRQDGTTAIVLQGGLNDKNERLGDGVWILTVS